MSIAIERLTSALAGRYRIDGEVGQGGMATVYLAQDLKHDRKVAIKVLRAELAAVIGAEANSFLYLLRRETTRQPCSGWNAPSRAAPRSGRA